MGTFSAYEIPGIQIGSDGRRYPVGSSPDGFAPEFLCLAYMKFEADGLSVRHAYFPMTHNLAAFAVAEFSAVAATGQWATVPIRSEVNFESFTFGSQQLLVFYIDPAGAPARCDPENLVQFAEWSARDPKTPATRKARNNSFLNPEIQSWSGMEVLTLENWYVADAGQPIVPPLQLYYTMNVHLLMRCRLAGADDGARELPLVLDPDTGNMGAEP